MDILFYQQAILTHSTLNPKKHIQLKLIIKYMISKLTTPEKLILTMLAILAVVMVSGAILSGFNSYTFNKISSHIDYPSRMPANFILLCDGQGHFSVFDKDASVSYSPDSPPYCFLSESNAIHAAWSVFKNRNVKEPEFNYLFRVCQ